MHKIPIYICNCFCKINFQYNLREIKMLTKYRYMTTLLCYNTKTLMLYHLLYNRTKIVLPLAPPTDEELDQSRYFFAAAYKLSRLFPYRYLIIFIVIVFSFFSFFEKFDVFLDFLHNLSTFCSCPSPFVPYSHGSFLL